MARGSVFKKPSGTYAFRADIGADPAIGKRRQLQRSGFRNKREAEAALHQVMQAVRSGTGVSSGSTTVEPVPRRLATGPRHRLKDTTWSSYAVAVDRIKHGLGRRKLQALTPLEIERFYAALAETGGRAGRPLKPKTVRNTHVVLRKALSDADRLGLVPRNAAAAARPPALSHGEHRTWSTDDLRDFFTHVADDRFFAAYVLFATTGMRRGEVLGLRWGDVDLDAGQLAVVNTLTTVNYKPVLSTPKTKRSRRVIYLDDQTVDVLRQHRRAQGEERKAAGP
ncbi:MAG: site-specific integrase, partial [Acidimicrobiia bacterium]|nr:site-specific integrase [Acidimicrobiia bacterium]